MPKDIKIQLRVHNSMEEADAFDLQSINSMSGEERIKNALIMMAPYYETTPRLERIYRVTEQKDLPISDNWRVGL